VGVLTIPLLTCIKMLSPCVSPLTNSNTHVNGDVFAPLYRLKRVRRARHMGTQTQIHIPPAEGETERGKQKVKVKLVLPAPLVDRLREMSRQTGMPMSLLATLILSSAIAPGIEIPRYTRPKLPRSKLLEEKTGEGGGA